MKKILIFTAFIIGFSFAHAQITGGGGYESESKSQPSKKEKGVFKNYLNIYLHSTSPMGSLGTAPANINDLINSEIIEGNFGQSIGAGINIGQTFYLKNLDLGDDNLKLGIEATYLNLVFMFGNIPRYTVGGEDAFLYASSQFLGTKLGPSISYNPFGKFIVGAKVCIEPTYYFIDIQTSFDSYDYDEIYTHPSTLLIRKSLGIYARNRPFYFGFDLSFGGGTFTEATFYNDYDYTDDYKDINFKTTRFDFNIGFSF